MAVYHQMSLPLFEDRVSFDEFLFIYALGQQMATSTEEKYALCRTVDPRLIDFLKYHFSNLDSSTTTVRNARKTAAIPRHGILSEKLKRFVRGSCKEETNI